jgi:RNA recognition motif-containing protein
LIQKILGLDLILPCAAAVNLVMERVAKRPRGFAFLSYASEEESKNAMEGMQGKFLDGRVIFVEVARQRKAAPPAVHQFLLICEQNISSKHL